MTIYVDGIIEYPFRIAGHNKWCHLASDSDSTYELYMFARGLGLKRHWFQDGRNPHYDLTEGMRRKAINSGAVPVDDKTMYERCFRKD